MENGQAFLSDLLSTLALGMDILLIIIAVWMIVSVLSLQIGGAVRKSAINIVFGAMIMGLAELIGTVFNGVGIREELNEVLHRGIIFIGFIWLMIGINKLLKAFNRD
jgi:hypothetical protein